MKISSRIDKEFDIVRNPSCLGDVILLLHGDTAVHSCVYVAGGIVFSKNGMGMGQPFVLERLDDVIDYYQQLHGSIRLGFCRRKAKP